MPEYKSWVSRTGNERYYNAAIVNMLGYLAEKTDLLQKLVELDASSHEYESSPHSRQNDRKKQRAEERACAHIIKIAARHISIDENPDFAHLLTTNGDLRTRAETIAGYSPERSGRQHDKTKTWEWRTISGHIAIDLLMELLEIKIPRHAIASLLSESMKTAIKKRGEKEEEKSKEEQAEAIARRSIAQFRAFNLEFQPINTQLSTTLRTISSKHGEDKPTLDDEGHALLWIIESLVNPKHPFAVDFTALASLMDEVNETYKHKPSSLLKGFNSVVLDLVNDERTHPPAEESPAPKGKHSRQATANRDVDNMYREFGGG